MAAANPSETAKQALILAAVIAALYFASSVMRKDDPPRAETTAEAAAREDARKDSAWIAEMQLRVKRQLKDPDSAQFRNTYVSRKMGMPVVCGEVNSNNSMGGKSGFQRFVAAGSIIALEEQMGAGEMGKTWAAVC